MQSEEKFNDICKVINKRRYSRVVESQSYNSTRQLVDSDSEQEILEQLIDKNKPPYPDGFDGLHYLLKTPFRYPPLKHGSRFGSKNEPSIFYGSFKLNTALCETAYYRFRFLFYSEAKLRPSFIEYTSFSASINCKNCLNLTKGDWKGEKDKISSPMTYEYSQVIGKKAKEQGFKTILYYCAREENAQNIAILSPDAFAKKTIKTQQHWNAYVDYNTVNFTNDGKKDSISFPVEKFFVEGIFPIIES
jgi:hypothetical protein